MSAISLTLTYFFVRGRAKADKRCVQVVENVLIVNPGPLSKRKGPGTFAQMTIYPRKLTEQERREGKPVANKLFERARVDVVRI